MAADPVEVTVNVRLCIDPQKWAREYGSEDPPAEIQSTVADAVRRMAVAEHQRVLVREPDDD